MNKGNITTQITSSARESLSDIKRFFIVEIF
jgi:hypothetical protein